MRARGFKVAVVRLSGLNSRRFVQRDEEYIADGFIRLLLSFDRPVRYMPLRSSCTSC